MMNPGLKREPWDRTRPDEDWNRDDPPRKPPARDPLCSPIRSRRKSEMLADIRARLAYAQAEKVLLTIPDVSERERTEAQIPQIAEKSTDKSRVELFWQTRPCFICGKTEACEHREYEVALAYVFSGKTE